MNAETRRPSQSPPPLLRRWLSWLPIPVAALAIMALWVVDPRTPYESRPLMVLLNVVFTGLAALCIYLLTTRGFLGTGQPGLLMFGCGSLVWGITSVSAAMIVDRINTTITIHNVGMLAAAGCHLAGLLWRGRLARPGRWLVVGGAGALLAAALIVWLARAGLTPVFFVQGSGGTMVRQVVLVLAITLFAGVAWLMIAKFQQQSAFYYWYGLGLALVATGLTGVLLLTVQGGLLGWTNRLTQYLGSAYLFIAAFMAARENGAWKISLATMEDAWRLNESLAELREQKPLWPALRYGSAVGAVAVAFGLHAAITGWGGPGLPTFITFYPAIMVVALLAGCGPGLLATGLSAAVAGYWILPPIGRFYIAAPMDRMALVIFSGMGVFMSVVAELNRRYRLKAAAYDREAAVRATQQENKFLADLLDHASQPFAVGYSDGRLGRVNCAFERLTGYSAEELRRVHWSLTLTPPDWRDLEKQKLDELHRTGQPILYEKEYIRKDGARVPIELLVHVVCDAAGQPEYYYSFISDITARKQAEAALRTSEERYRLLAENTDDFVELSDTAGHVLYVSPSIERRFGLTPADVQPGVVIVHPDDMETVRHARARNLAGESTIIEYRNRDRAGNWIWLEGQCTPIRGADGRVEKLLLVSRDITARKQAATELAQHLKELQSANDDLSRFNRAAVGRELRMIELKKEINALCAAAGQPPRYNVDFTK